jgi:hypothetical protein
MSDTDALRRMVREVLQEVLPRGAAGATTGDPTGDPMEAPDVRRVQVRDDRDLADLVTQVLNLAEDPGTAADLRAGRIRFRLDGDQPRTAATVPAPIDVERGAVTERLVARAAREHRPLRLGPRAVVTPLARDRARALGVALDRTASPSSSEQRGETR